MFDFEVFHERGRQRREENPIATLQTKGVITLNPAAYEALESPEAVELLYAPRARVIGVRAVDPSLPHAYKPRKQKDGYARSLSAQAFFKRYGIKVEVTRRYPARMVDGVLAIELGEQGEA